VQNGVKSTPECTILWAKFKIPPIRLFPLPTEPIHRLLTTLNTAPGESLPRHGRKQDDFRNDTF